MRRYLAARSVPALLRHLYAEVIATKVQQRTSGPHKGSIPFARGSLFHLLKNPVYRARIVQKGMEYGGNMTPSSMNICGTPYRPSLPRKRRRTAAPPSNE